MIFDFMENKIGHENVDFPDGQNGLQGSISCKQVQFHVRVQDV